MIARCTAIGNRELPFCANAALIEQFGDRRSNRPLNEIAQEVAMKSCCERMRAEFEWSCRVGHSREECPDALIKYIPKYNEYGLIIHDGGTSMVRISFCPWCGTKLPDSQRDRWFERLEKLGIDPATDEVPTEYLSEAWYSAEPN